MPCHKNSSLYIDCGSTCKLSGHFLPFAQLKLLTAVHILDHCHPPMIGEKLLRYLRIKCCVAFKGGFGLVPRIFHSSHSTAFAIISKCSLQFFLCYFFYSSDSRWKLPSHGNPARGKYLISNVFLRH